MSHFVTSVITKHDPTTEVGKQELARLMAPYDEDSDDPKFTTFIDDDDYDTDETTGKKGYWTNPQAKWDWYAVGDDGRWANIIPTKSGENVNHAQLRELDLSINHTDYAKALRYWEVVVDGDPLHDDENKDDFFNMYKPGYYQSRYGDKQTYATEQATFLPFALVDVDGNWLEQGEMGWFGLSDVDKNSAAKFTQQFVQLVKSQPDNYITTVDCHI